MSTEATASQPRKRNRRVEVGIVDRASMDKTRRVRIEFQVRHPKYGKFIKRRSFLTVHDENNVSGVGDQVQIMPCRPVSKTKQWKVVQVLAKAVGEVRLHDESPASVA